MSPPTAGTLVVDGIWAHARVAITANSAPLSRVLMSSSFYRACIPTARASDLFWFPNLTPGFGGFNPFIDFGHSCVVALAHTTHTPKTITSPKRREKSDERSANHPSRHGLLSPTPAGHRVGPSGNWQ